MKKLLSILFVAALLVFTSCKDNDYDLSDIDTTARFYVKDLVVPVNIDDITLDYIIDLETDSKIKRNGDEYAVIEEGTFCSNLIKVPEFTTEPRTYSTENIDVTLTPSTSSASKRARQVLAYAPIPKNETDINISATNVDQSIVKIDHINTSMAIKLTIKFEGLTHVMNKIGIEKLEINCIKGLQMSISGFPNDVYDPNTGIINIGDAMTNDDHCYEVTINITGIDADKAGIKLENGNFSLTNSAYVSSGRLVLYSDQIKEGHTLDEIPKNISYTLQASIGACTVNSFSGKIKYDITGINFDPIDLNGIPDILSQEGTNLVLRNPQIYLSLNNPLMQSGYNLYAQAGLCLTGNATYSVPNPIIIDQKENKYMLSPTDMEIPKYIKENHSEYRGAKHIAFPDLSNVVSGKSIPKMIRIDVLSPCIPPQNVTDFRLGTDIPAVEGKWLVYAPLELTDSTFIKYTKTWDDWQDEDLDGLTVETAEINATISSDVPLALEVTCTLLCRKGQLTGSTTLAANAKNANIYIPLSGTNASQIYGMRIDAKIQGSNQPLSPNQKITVKNLKATVSGYYDKEL